MERLHGQRRGAARVIRLVYCKLPNTLCENLNVRERPRRCGWPL
jgi:hypothetical protein